MNNVTLIGRLVRDVELTYSDRTQTAIGRFTLAVDKAKKEDGCNFIGCQVFGKQAENLSKYKKKGEQIALQGHIDTYTYEKDSKKQTKTYVIADRVEFLAKGNVAGAYFKDKPQPQAQSEEDYIPEGFEEVEEDVPF